jgi:ferritin-like metal-binding protein YciE
MTIDQQLEAAEAQLTKLQQRLVEYAFDADERGRIYDEIRETRDEITRLYNLLPA